MSSIETKQIKIVVNGRVERVPTGCHVAEVLRVLELDPSRVAIEKDGTIIKKQLWDKTPVEAGAQLEIVEFVGGG